MTKRIPSEKQLAALAKAREARKAKSNPKAAAKAAKREGDRAEHNGKGKSVVKLSYKIAYELTALPGTTGDEVAQAFSDATVDDNGVLDYTALCNVGDQNGVDVKGRWGHLNVGQQRMNLGNVLRGMARNDKRVVIGSKVLA